MPNYDFKCCVCETVKEVFIPLALFREHVRDFCCTCNTTRIHDLVLTAPAIDDWGQGRYFEHLSARGMTFYDKKSYREHLRKNGLVEWSPKTGMPGSGV